MHTMLSHVCNACLVFADLRTTLTLGGYSLVQLVCMHPRALSCLIAVRTSFV
jgi:hypothetical protein